MGSIQRALRILTVSGALLTVGACNGGLLGNILGGGTQQQNSGQLNGTVRSTDLRNQRINVQDNSNGQSFWVQYDNRTQVVYRNQGVSPTAIRQGDNVTLQLQNNGNNTYYTNYVQIN
jgi:uncharacterized protein YcfJ